MNVCALKLQRPIPRSLEIVVRDDKTLEGLLAEMDSRSGFAPWLSGFVLLRPDR